jgi:hypothetical protein
MALVVIVRSTVAPSPVPSWMCTQLVPMMFGVNLTTRPRTLTAWPFNWAPLP